MDLNSLHIYSAYLKRGGAGIASDSLFNFIKQEKVINNLSRSSFYESNRSKYFESFVRIAGKITAIPTFQNIFYFPYVNKFINSNQMDFDLVHAHWLNNIPLNSIPKSKALIITAHDQWLVNSGWAWDPNSLNSPTKRTELIISKFFKLINPIESPLDFISDNYPLNKLITPSNWLKEYILSKSNLNTNQIKVIPNLIDNSTFKFNEDIWFDYKNNSNLFSIVISSSYWKDWRKGKDLIYDLFNKIIYAFDGKVIFNIIGDMKINKELEKFSICHGVVKNKKKIAEIYNKSHCMIFPSRLENLTQTICEALLCGCPSLAFDVGGNKEILDQDIFGYCLKYLDISEFVEAIKDVKLSEKFSNRKEIALNASIKFDNTKILKKHMHVYKDSLSD